ncbi:hypothetical protein M1512_01095 [Patescibacteria group bacterium]|nr:hypothetical protein [Patescibacteria group bacterium]
MTNNEAFNPDEISIKPDAVTSVPYNQRDALWLIDQRRSDQRTDAAEIGDPSPQSSTQEYSTSEAGQILGRLQAEADELRAGKLPPRFAISPNQGNAYITRGERKKLEEAAIKDALKRVEEAIRYRIGVKEYNEQLSNRRKLIDQELEKARIRYGAKLVGLFSSEIGREIDAKLDEKYPLIAPAPAHGSYYETRPKGQSNRLNAEKRASDLARLLKEFDRQGFEAAARHGLSNKREVIIESESSAHPTESEGMEANSVSGAKPVVVQAETGSDPKASISSPPLSTETEAEAAAEREDFKRFLDLNKDGGVSVSNAETNNTDLHTTSPEADKEKDEAAAEFEAFKEFLNLKRDSTSTESDDSIEDEVRPKEEETNEDADHNESTVTKTNAANYVAPSTNRLSERILKQITKLKTGGSRAQQNIQNNKITKTFVDASKKLAFTCKFSYDWVVTKVGMQTWENLSQQEQQKRKRVAIVLGAVAVGAIAYGIFSGGEGSGHQALQHLTNHLTNNLHHTGNQIHNIKAAPASDKLAIKGINLNTAAPWTVAHAVNPSNANALLNEAAAKFQQLYGTHYVLAPYNGTIMFMNGPSIINPHDQLLMNQIIVSL